MARSRGKKLTEFLGTLISDEQRVRIDKFLDKYRLTSSHMVRTAVEEYMTKYEKEHSKEEI